MAVLSLDRMAAARAAHARYRASAKGKAARARYRATPKGKAARKAARVKARATQKGKAARKAYRTRHRARHRKASRSFSRKVRAGERVLAPFVGCDGEGVTRDGRHYYALLRIGDRELFRGGERLTTGEILAFILDHPNKHDILVGFSFEYDVTSILVDLPAAARDHLLATYRQTTPVSGTATPSRPRGFARRWTWATFAGHGTFGLNWLSRNHLSVCRPHPLGAIFARFAQASDRASIRTIYDTFGFFQTSFVKALQAWEVGGAKVARIEAMKAQRSAFATVTDDIRSYNADECLLLAETMEKFRAVCFAADIRPRTWNGAGKIASFLHDHNATTRRSDLEKLLPPGVLRASHAAYYGGRFEITRCGHIAETVYEHDINSAYPAAMRRLPCLLHGKWRKASGGELAALGEDEIFVCPIHYKHPIDQFLCGLPFRSLDGRLKWLTEANGVYWSPEIRSAERLGASCAYRAGWLYERQCACKPFSWVEELYRRRKALGDLQGKPLKLGINALYGKLAQRIGEPKFANPVWAGLITALVRAALNDAIVSTDPRRVIMLATDAIYTIGRPLSAKAARRGDGLGEWTVKTMPEIFIVQPGLYWSPDKLRSRGVSASVLGKYREDLEAAWAQWTTSGQDPIAWNWDIFGQIKGEPPSWPHVKIEFPIFVGLRLAAHWGKPELAGQWLDQERVMSFDWTAKRGPHQWSSDRRHAILAPMDGDPRLYSAHYEAGGTLASTEGWEAERMLFEAMPDDAPLSDL